MTRHPMQDQWDAALRREFSECVAHCQAATPTYAEPDPWTRCTRFLEGIVKTQPERVAALDLVAVLMSRSQAARVTAMTALEHAEPVSSPDA